MYYSMRFCVEQSFCSLILLEFVNVSADDVLRYLAYIVNVHLLLAPALKLPQALFIGIHCFGS